MDIKKIDTYKFWNGSIGNVDAYIKQLLKENKILLQNNKKLNLKVGTLESKIEHLEADKEISLKILTEFYKLKIENEICSNVEKITIFIKRIKEALEKQDIGLGFQSPLSGSLKLMIIYDNPYFAESDSENYEKFELEIIDIIEKEKSLYRKELDEYFEIISLSNSPNLNYELITEDFSFRYHG